MDGPNSKLFDLIVGLGDTARPLIPYLKTIVESERPNHEDRRVHAAYALAQLEPEDPKWVGYLKARYRSRTASGWSEARERLVGLKALALDE